MGDIPFTTFEEFERAVMQRMLEDDTSVNRLLREQYNNAHIINRNFTGAGFFTTLSIPEHIARITEPVAYGYGDVLCSLNDTILSGGFVLFIRDGAMTCLEGYTFCDAWPESITTYKLYRDTDV